MTDYLVDDTIYGMFTTRALTGIPTVLSGSPVAQIYENDSGTQITAGITLGVSHDSIVGMNLLTIVATGGNGFEAGKDYNVMLSAGTVDSVSVVGEVVWSFSLGRSASVQAVDAGVDVVSISGDSVAADNLEAQFDTTGYVHDTAPATQSQLGNLEVVGAAIHQIAAGYVLTVGTQSENLFSDTEELNGTRHEHTSVGDAMDLYYEFHIGGGVPTSVEIHCALFSNNDDLEVYGYDWVSTSWKQIGVLDGRNSTVNLAPVYNMFIDMVGKGSDEGKVRVRFYDGAFTLSNAVLRIDQIFVAFSPGGSEGYDNGAIWIDTNLSNTGIQVGIDGTARNPVSTIGAANSLAALTNLRRFEVAPGSAITFAANQQNQLFRGHDWTLALGGQDIAGTWIEGSIASGVFTGAAANFVGGHIGTITLADDTHIEGAGIDAGTITLPAGAVHFEKCFHSGTSLPIIDFGGAVGSTTAHFHDYHGGLNIHNFGDSGTDIIHLDGHGRIDINSNSAGGTLNVRGHWDINDSGASTTINKDDITVGVVAIPTTAMRGTDSAATEAKQDTMQTAVDAIPTTAMRGTDSAALASVLGAAVGDDISADIAAVKAETVLIVADTGELQADDVPGLIAALNNITVADILTTAITESYSTQGSPPTLAQFISAMTSRQGLTKSAIVDTTWTLYKLDGTTVAMTITLDSATIPAILTRAT